MQTRRRPRLQWVRIQLQQSLRDARRASADYRRTKDPCFRALRREGLADARYWRALIEDWTAGTRAAERHDDLTARQRKADAIKLGISFAEQVRRDIEWITAMPYMRDHCEVVY